MSIIIRLQNLPWAANAVDIRRYFSGLSIPEGGVHIAGGERGDAFIIFSTDEDARQAMKKDGGKIKDMKVNLLLSSRAEMTRVIEKARNQTLSLQPLCVAKATANDNDCQIYDHSPSSNRSRKDYASPKDHRKTYSKRDRSRSRSRSQSTSPFRKTIDRDCDVDSCINHGKHDNPYDEKDWKYKNSRNCNTRNLISQDRKPEMGSKIRMEPIQNKSFDPEIGATPQSFDSMHLDDRLRTGSMEFNLRQGNLPDDNLPFHDSRNQAASETVTSSLTFPIAINLTPIEQDVKQEPLLPTTFPTLDEFSSTFDNIHPFEARPFEARPFEARPFGNYETKRSSPTPATLAPKVKPNPPYRKGYGMSSHSDLYNLIYSNFGNYPDPTASTYGTDQTAEMGDIPAVLHDRKNVLSNKPVYGAEPHACFEQSSETNQASKSYTASVPAHDSESFGKRLSFMSSTGVITTMPPRIEPYQSCFKLEVSTLQENLYSKASNDLRTASAVYSARHIDATNLSCHDNIPSPGGNKLGRKDPSWLAQPSGASNLYRPALLTPPEHLADFPDVDAINVDDGDDKNVKNMSPSSRGIGHPHQREIKNHDLRSQYPPGCFKKNPSLEEFNQLRTRENTQSRDNQLPLNEPRYVPSTNEPRHGPPFNEPRHSSFINKTRHGSPFNEPRHGSSFNEPRHGSPFNELRHGSPFSEPRHGSPFNEPKHGSFINKARHCSPLNEPIYGSSLSEPKHESKYGSLNQSKGLYPEGRNERSSNQVFLSLTVVVNDLPYDIMESDVLGLFRGIFVSPENLKLTHDSCGIPSAYVKFMNPYDYKEALSRSRQKNIADCCPEITPCSLIEFENAPVFSAHSNVGTVSSPPQNSYQQGLIAQEENLCIKLVGLPASCIEDDIVHFFDGLEILDIIIQENVDNRNNKLGYVEFGTSADFHSALNSTGRMIGHRYIIVTVTSKEIMNLARKTKSVKKEPLFLSTSRDSVSHCVPNKSPQSGPNDGPVYCIAINGLPEIVKKCDIADFFAEDQIFPQAIHVILNSKKLPSGDAFAEFTTIHEFEIALQRNGKYLAGCRVSVNSITYQEMTGILKSTLSASAPLFRSPHEDRPTRALMPMPPPRKESRNFRERELQSLDETSSANFGPLIHQRSQPRYASNNIPFDLPRSVFVRPPIGQMRASLSSRLGNRSQRFPLFSLDGHPCPISGDPPSHLDGNGPPQRFRFPGYQRGSLIPKNNSPQNFAMPSCMVAIKNLHFRAGLEEIVDAFQGFPLDKSKILQKYNDSGQATGDALVTFRCHEDAARAVEEVNQKIIFGRPIYLSLV